MNHFHESDFPDLIEVHGLQYEKLSEWPTALKTAEELSEMVGVSVERLNKYADARQIPHYRFDNGPPKFRTKEVKEWIMDSGLAVKVNPVQIRHRVINYNVTSNELQFPVPKELVNLQGLQELEKEGMPSGVYFLIDGDRLVYIGQSVSPLARISTHVHEGVKQFTHAFLLPIPKYDLDMIEGALIRALPT